MAIQCTAHVNFVMNLVNVATILYQFYSMADTLYYINSRPQITNVEYSKAW